MYRTSSAGQTSWAFAICGTDFGGLSGRLRSARHRMRMTTPSRGTMKAEYDFSLGRRERAHYRQPANPDLRRGGQVVMSNSMLLRSQQPSVAFVTAAVANVILGCCERITALLPTQQHAVTKPTACCDERRSEPPPTPGGGLARFGLRPADCRQDGRIRLSIRSRFGDRNPLSPRSAAPARRSQGGRRPRPGMSGG